MDVHVDRRPGGLVGFVVRAEASEAVLYETVLRLPRRSTPTPATSSRQSADPPQGVARPSLDAAVERAMAAAQHGHRESEHGAEEGVGGDGDVSASAVTGAGVEVEDFVDEQLRASGFVRVSDWQPSRRGPASSTAVVRQVELAPVGAADLQVLESLRSLARMARGPVTASALVPTIMPSRRAAEHVLRRLVAAGHVRVVDRTSQPAQQLLYAPAGSTWAPDSTGY